MPTLSPEATAPERGPERRFAIDRLMPFPFTDLPRSEAEMKKRFGDPGAEIGRLPWLIQESYARLVEAFKSRRQDEDPRGVGRARLPRGRDPQPPGPDRQRRRAEDRPARLVAALLAAARRGHGEEARPQSGRRRLPRRSQGVRVLDAGRHLRVAGQRPVPGRARQARARAATPRPTTTPSCGARGRCSGSAWRGPRRTSGSYWYTAWTAAGRPELK